MAMTLTLGGINLLDHTKHAAAAEGMRFRPVNVAETVGLAGLDGLRVVGYHGDHLEIALRLHIIGTTHNTLLANYREIQEQLRLALRYSRDGLGSLIQLIYKWDGATTGTVYDVLYGELGEEPHDSELIGFAQYDQILQLTCQPYAKPNAAATSISSTGIANYASFSLGTIVGDVMPPVRFRIRNLSGFDCRYFRAALRSRGTVANFISRYEPGLASPTGYAITRPSPLVTTTTPRINVAYASLAANPTLDNFGAATLGTELLVNGDWEANTFAGWNTGLGAGGAIVTTGTPNGAYHFQMSPGTRNTAHLFLDPSQMVTQLVQGQAYRFSIAMKVSTPQVAGSGVKAIFTDANQSDGLYNVSGAKVLIESTSTTYVTHTWEFIAPAVGALRIDLIYDGAVGTSGFIDDASLKPITRAPTSWTLTGSITDFMATDSENEIAGSRVDAGTAALGVGQGDTSNHVSQAITVVSGGTYRIRARIKKLAGPTPTTYVPSAVNVRAESGANVLTLSSSSPVYSTVEGTIVASGTTLTVKIYGDFQTGGIVDSILVVRDDATNDELVRFTISTNTADHLGQFAVYARMKTTTFPFAVQLRSGGLVGDRSVNEPVIVSPSAAYQVIKLGRVNVPERQITAAVPEAIRFGVWLVPAAMGFPSTSYTLEIYDVELVPIDEGFVEVILPAGMVAADGEYVEINTDDRIPYTALLNTSQAFKTSLPHGGNLRLPVGAVRVYAHIARSLTDDAGDTDIYTLNATYTPRYQVLYG